MADLIPPLSFPAGSSLLARAEHIAHEEPERVALLDDTGTRLSYADLVWKADALARVLLAAAQSQTPVDDLHGERIAFLVDASPAWVITQWAIWRAGAIAVPLSPLHPDAERAYVLDHAMPVLAVVDGTYEASFQPQCDARGLTLINLDRRGVATDESLLPAPTSQLYAYDPANGSSDRDAMMLYTSGTTSQPKGVVTTHGNLNAQLKSLSEAWRGQPSDHALLVLPLHHVHGIVNVIACTLYFGGRVTMLPRFNADDVTTRLCAQAEGTAEGGDPQDPPNVFMAVPTIYRRLVAESTGREDAWRIAGDRIRLMVSGSAALPEPLFERWRDLTGHALLERYGMTEIGMALSNPYAGERVAGTVGGPLPLVSVRLREDGDVVAGDGDGEIEVAGPSIFRSYFGNDDATIASFTEDGWFRTGDRARRVGDRYAILGRTNIDILKTGGEKVSALEIESALLRHPAIAAVAVVGVPSEEWGQEVVAVVELEPGATLTTETLRTFAKGLLSPFKVPRRLVCGQIPRNALGKVQKPRLLEQLASSA